MIEEALVLPSSAEEALQGFPEGHLNKAGLIVKESPDDSRKLRLIIDMFRSGANDAAVVPEQGILPRPANAVRRQGWPVEQHQLTSQMHTCICWCTRTNSDIAE